LSATVRYLGVAARLAKTSLAAQMQYRADFLIQIAMAFFWVFWNVAPAVIIFRLRPAIAGFDMAQAMLVISAFLILKALLEGFISPNLLQVVQHIRTGTLDFILLKPVDSMLMVSTARWVPAKLVDLSCGIGIAIWSVTRIDPTPSPRALLLSLLMLLSGAVTLYALWMLVICIAFWLVRVDNLSFLFSSIFDAGRWPISIFRGWVRIFLTFVLPVALMTSFPAMAALGRLETEAAAIAFFGSFAFLLLARRVWVWAVGHYASASS
jgi:ABC-2 type transport system permease protein